VCERERLYVCILVCGCVRERVNSVPVCVYVCVSVCDRVMVYLFRSQVCEYEKCVRVCVCTGVCVCKLCVGVCVCVCVLACVRACGGVNYSLLQRGVSGGGGGGGGGGGV